MSTQRPNSETLRLLVDLTKGAPERQARVAESVDSKLVQVFAASSIVISLGMTRTHAISATLLFMAVVSYVGVSGATTYGLWFRRLRVTDSATELWSKLYDASPEDALHSVIADLADGYVENEAKLNKKRWALGLTVLLAGFEAVLLGIAVGLTLT